MPQEDRMNETRARYLASRTWWTICFVLLANSCGRPAHAQNSPSELAAPVRSAAPTHRLSGIYLNPNYEAGPAPRSGWDAVGRFSANLGLLLAGCVTAIIVHELAHLVVAASVGLNLRWPSGGFEGPLIPLWRLEGDVTPGNIQAVASAGFIASALTTETLLLLPQVPKDNLFVVGLLLTSIMNNLLYPITDLALGGYGDYEILRETGTNLAQIHVPVLLHSAFALCRLFFLEDEFLARFNPWATPKDAGITIVFQW